MFDIGYEEILERMLERIPDNIDKREGSIIYDALAPTALEIAKMYTALSGFITETFGDTASREYLIRRANERGIIPEPATKAILKGRFNIKIPIGSRFSLGDLNYIVKELIELNDYKMECEQYGTVGNGKFGQLIPIDYIEGLTSAEITELLIPGEDEEDTEDLRQRYFDSLESQAFGGNITDYKEKTLALAGVGGVKVYPVWNGGGTVKLVIMDSTYGVPSSALVEAVQSAVDPVTNQGQGEGFAPIGHVVTVEGVTPTTVNITTSITYESGWTWGDVEPHANDAIDSYFNELSSNWDDDINLIVRISQIETRLLNLAGILDIANTTINGNAVNLPLGADSIPVRGAISG